VYYTERREAEQRRSEKVKTVRDAMERLGVNKTRVHWFIRHGRLRATQVTGGLWVIEPRELERFARIPRRNGKPSKKLAKSR